MTPKQLEKAIKKSNKLYNLIRRDVSQETLNNINDYVELERDIEMECNK